MVHTRIGCAALAAVAVTAALQAEYVQARPGCPSPQKLAKELVDSFVHPGDLGECANLSKDLQEIYLACEKNQTLACFEDKMESMEKKEKMDVYTCFNGLCESYSFKDLVINFSFCQKTVKEYLKYIVNDGCLVLPKDTCQLGKDFVEQLCDMFPAECDMKVSDAIAKSGLECAPDSLQVANSMLREIERQRAEAMDESKCPNNLDMVHALFNLEASGAIKMCKSGMEQVEDAFSPCFAKSGEEAMKCVSQALVDHSEQVAVAMKVCRQLTCSDDKGAGKLLQKLETCKKPLKDYIEIFAEHKLLSERIATLCETSSLCDIQMDQLMALAKPCAFVPEALALDEIILA